MTWGIVIKIKLLLTVLGAISLAAVGIAFCQSSIGEDSSNPQGLRGKAVFEVRCATCHGLDGLGGEHAPDIVRQTAVKTLSDQALLGLIHNGIPEAGMPAFPDMGKDDSQALVVYLRFLQGKSGGKSAAGDPLRGRALFFGKAGCAACHSQGQSVSESLAGFARDHEAAEIGEAILKPPAGGAEAATAIARDGQRFSGIIRNEDNASLQLQDEDGRFYLLMKSSLKSVERQSGAPMPTDYGQRLDDGELNDLIGYILHEARASNPQSEPTERDSAPDAQH